MERSRSVYVRGAEDGLVLGPVMAAGVVLTGVAAYVPWVAVPALALLASVPALVYILLRRGYAADGCGSSLSALWLQGICPFFFGGLLMAAAAYAAIRWGRPGFVAEQVTAAAALYSAAPDAGAREMGEALGRAVEARILPTAIQVALELLYAAVFSGSILSVVLAAVIRRRHRPTKQF